MNVDLELILQKATLQPEEVPIFCLCSEKSSNKEWTKIFIKNLKRDGFYNINSNIDFLPGQDYNNTLQNCLRCISKLVIILSPVSDDQFTSVVNTAVSFILNKNLHVDMIPVITSDEVDLPFCLSSVIPFQAWDDDWSKLRLALRKSDPSDKGNARLELFCQVFGKVLHLRIIEMEEELRQKDKIAMDVLRGWGLDIHDDKVNFHINTLLGIGNTQPICLLNLYNSLFHQKQFKFIRICDIKRFDLEGLQINKQLNSDLFEIFETLRKNVCKQSWYHYRRNGIKHNESSELSLNPFKQNNAKKREEGRESICFPKFKTFQSRVDTFEDFPIQVKEFRIKLSRAGFFNLHTSDYVQCFSCGGCIRSWNSDADPMVAHKKYHQNCTFILSKNVDVSSGHSTKICNEDLKTIEGRVQSFKQILNAETSYCIDDDVINRFTEAGFYYCGIAEDVICHSCNLGLANIQNCLQPMKLHRKLSPDCSYLRNFVDNTVDSGADVSYEIEPYLEIEIRKHENI